MTREEAITWCDRFNNAWANADKKDYFPDIKYSDTLDQLFYLAGQALRQQDVTDKDVGKNSGWISVKDRMPVCGERVLIKPTYGDFVCEAMFSASHVWVGKGVWYEDVTYWMPLPEPPEDGTV